MLTPQQIKEIENEFDDGFREQLSVVEADMIKSFIITIINNLLAERDNNTLIKHIDSEIERLEKKRKGMNRYSDISSISPVINYLLSLKAELTKSK